MKFRGISSGSYITNLFDSLVNLTMWHLCHYISSNFGNLIDKIIKDENEFLNIENDDISSDIFSKTKNYLTNVCVCGDDTLIFTYPKMILLHFNVCHSLGMNTSLKHTCRNSSEDIFFLGRYWDVDCRPFQSERYMSAHIVFRSRWFKKEEVNFDISKYLHVYRIISICCQFYNGLHYINKTFGNWSPMVNFFNEKLPFVYLRDWPKEDYLSIKQFEDIFDWRNF